RIGWVVVWLTGVHSCKPGVGLLREAAPGRGQEAVDQSLLGDARRIAEVGSREAGGEVAPVGRERVEEVGPRVGGDDRRQLQELAARVPPGPVLELRGGSRGEPQP